jgi:hypothetical protein
MTYYYPLTATASNQCHPGFLHQEIVAATLPSVLNGVTCDLGTSLDRQLRCVFAAALPDQASLDAVVAAHNGTDPFNSFEVV